MQVNRLWVLFKFGKDESTHQITDVSMNPLQGAIEVMRVEDHERIVAELRAEVFDLKSVQESLIETAAKNEDYYEFELSRLRELVAKQAKVIEKLKKDIDDLLIYVDSDADRFGDRYWPTRNTLIAMLKETTAISDVLHERYSDDDTSAATSDPLMILLNEIEKGEA